MSTVPPDKIDAQSDISEADSAVVSENEPKLPSTFNKAFYADKFGEDISSNNFFDINIDSSSRIKTKILDPLFSKGPLSSFPSQSLIDVIFVRVGLN